MKHKKAQNEIVGFVLIIVIVSVIGVIFLSLMIGRGEPIRQDSVQISNLLASSMYYTSDCAVNYIPNYKDGQDLINVNNLNATTLTVGNANITGLLYGNGSQLTGLPETDLTRYAEYQFGANNFNGSGNLTTIGKGTLGSLDVDTDTLVVNAVGYEGRVGIGTGTPDYKLDIQGVTGTGVGVNLFSDAVSGDRPRLRIYGYADNAGTGLGYGDIYYDEWDRLTFDATRTYVTGIFNAGSITLTGFPNG